MGWGGGDLEWTGLCADKHHECVGVYIYQGSRDQVWRKIGKIETENVKQMVLVKSLILFKFISRNAQKKNNKKMFTLNCWLSHTQNIHADGHGARYMNNIV